MNQIKIFPKLKNIKVAINGHHLTHRNFVPYYKYIHQKDNCQKNTYKSMRYIDIDSVSRIFKYENKFPSQYFNDDESSESTDDEIDKLFQKNKDYLDD